MAITLGTHVVFVMFIAGTCNNRSDTPTVCTIPISYLPSLLVPCYAGHMLFIKSELSRSDSPTKGATDKIMAVSDTINNNNVKKRVYFPTIAFITQVIDTNSPIEFRITINHTVNSILMITQCQYHFRSVNLLAILTSFVVEVYQRTKQTAHCFMTCCHVIFISTSFKTLTTNIV